MTKFKVIQLCVWWYNLCVLQYPTLGNCKSLAAFILLWFHANSCFLFFFLYFFSKKLCVFTGSKLKVGLVRLLIPNLKLGLSSWIIPSLLYFCWLLISIQSFFFQSLKSSRLLRLTGEIVFVGSVCNPMMFSSRFM